VVISDYNKGWVNYDLISYIRNRYSGPVFVDTKKPDLARLEGCIVKVNEQEYQRAVSYPTELIVTLGNSGARYQGQNFPTTKVEVVDVCGAGDTFLATLVAAFLSTGSVRESIVCANYAAAIAVQHSGVYALLPRDIKGILQHAKN
jgi:bifunctional ADP-heptose synthase (sugar kinase/adenylyltransferase)